MLLKSFSVFFDGVLWESEPHQIKKNKQSSNFHPQSNIVSQTTRCENDFKLQLRTAIQI